jgi:hypothetical protein
VARLPTIVVVRTVTVPLAWWMATPVAWAPVLTLSAGPVDADRAGHDRQAGPGVRTGQGVGPHDDPVEHRGAGLHRDTGTDRAGDVSDPR